MWFICLRRSIIDRDKWTTTVDEHLAWMKQQHERGTILFSGPDTTKAALRTAST